MNSIVSTELPVSTLEGSRHNPRKVFELEQLSALAASISQHGVLQPIRVIPKPDVPDRYIIVAGERRWRASILAGKITIPAVIAPPDEETRLREIQLDENMQRVPLTPLEEAQAYADLQSGYGYTIALLSTRFQHSQDYIRDRLALLSLQPVVQQMVESGKLKLGTALAVRAVEEPSMQEQLARRSVEEGWTVQQTVQIVRQYKHEQHQAILRRRREAKQLRLLQKLSELGPVVTPETYDPKSHHRNWDLRFPRCQTCSLKGNFLRSDQQVEEICVVPDCYKALLQAERSAQMEALRMRTRERMEAFGRVLATSEVTDDHFLYLLWVLIYYRGPTGKALREHLGLPPYSHLFAARSEEWRVIATWSREHVLTQIVFLCTNTLANLPNDLLPQGLKQSLITQFGLPSHVLGCSSPDQ